MSKTQARVEGINQQVVRADLRIPVEMYAQLEAIANEQGMKKHHITGRPMVSPVILELLEIGLHHYSSQNRLGGDSTGLVPDTIPGKQLDIEALKAELLGQLREELVTLANSITEKK
ncbi:hypothetical protein PL9214100014 [Planktothrix tepida PCC 9214]|uniref:Uncharacterized protein n=3 Tax=Planktothrix TaxID=54304 RepID=A0A1J1LDP6_9CYAN|nr:MULTISPECIES: hypothetical protein [Planktothrix]CAD5988589.1 hypothetical protein NO713_05743 [Planktothrix pseudagardhii]CUR30270.1 hypothetical protein PL9214100014 [Planktothrix tepida PCC 9214]